MALAEACERLERAGRSRDWKAVADTMRDFQHELGRLNDYVRTLSP
jgi:hypothetical protein